MAIEPQGDNQTPQKRTLPFALAELSERCMDNAAVAALLLDKFETQLNADIREIEQRLVTGDTGQIARTAHALKGAAGAVAAAALEGLAAEIEIMARSDQLDSIARELSALRVEVERCLAYLPVARGLLKSGTSGGLTATEAGQ